MSIPLLDIVSRESREPSVSTDWHRQVATAQGILDRHAEGRDTVLLADDVGMGKTYTAMCCMAHTIFQTSENLHKVLLVVPAGFILQKKWEQDLLTFDETYVTRNDPRERHLRPLAVSSYWALARNLTDYTNQYPGNAVREDRVLIGSVCRMALEWLKLRLHQTGKRLAGQYARLKEAALEEHDPGWLEFCAVYSPDAFFRFLSLEYRNHRQLVLDALKLAGEDGYFVHLMGLFRIFAETQDTHEANVFVIGMGSLGGRRDRTLGALVASWTAARYLASVGETPVAEELFGRMQAAGLDVCSHGASEWARTTGGEWFRKMGQCDMWGLGAYADAFFAGRGDELGRQVLAENGNDVYRLFLDAGVGIVGDKLARSGIELAVVDEAHAWKGWKNGARQFHERIAPYIRKKLIMTATPFQMQEKELENVFQVVAGEGSSSLGLVEELSRGNGLIDTCLRESQGFQDAWNSLSDADGLFLQQAFEDIPCEENADGAGQGNVPRPAASSCPKTCNVEECLGLVAGRSPALGRLVARAQSYHAAVRGLGAELGKVMIRHLKSRKIRLVHAGKDYCTQGLPSLPGGHHTLYTVPGYGSPADLIVQFMGMRAQQLVDADWKRGSNARLLGGITSSFEAFEEGACAIRPDSGLSEETNTYLRGFGKVCAASRHPKVEATARRAVDNYFDGRKTLIFCERLKSQDAIRRTIAAAISSRTLACESLRRQLLADYGCVDLYLSRSLCLACDWEQPAQPMIARAIAEAESALASLNACCAAPLTRREEAKLLDLFLSRALVQEHEENERADFCRLLGLALELLTGKDGFLPYVDRLAGTDKQSGNLVDDGEADDVSPAGSAQAAGTLSAYGALGSLAGHSVSESRSNLTSKLAAEIMTGRNIWFAPGDVESLKSLHEPFWKLVADETKKVFCSQVPGCAQNPACLSLSSVLRCAPETGRLMRNLYLGLRKVLLRRDRVRMEDPENDDIREGIVGYLASSSRNQGSAWRLVTDFLQDLSGAEGSLLDDAGGQSTRRHSLWRGVFLKGADGAQVAALLNGNVTGERRVNLCAAFNSPLLPDILICTAIGSEGIDLHRCCSDVIHHDLSWNPALFEQRIGRLDRVGSQAGKLHAASPDRERLFVGAPFLADNYDAFQYNRLHIRAQKIDVLLGSPEFSRDEQKREDLEIASVDENGAESIVDNAGDAKGEEKASVCLPEPLVDWLRMHLGASS